MGSGFKLTRLARKKFTLPAARHGLSVCFDPIGFFRQALFEWDL
jgi:hypothetical protein